MKKLLILMILLVMTVAVSYSRTPTAGNMFNVSDYSGTYGLEVNTDGSVVPMTTSSALGNATYPWTAATITTAGITTGNVTTVNATTITGTNVSITTATVSVLLIGTGTAKLKFKGCSFTIALLKMTPEVYDVWYNTNTYKLYIASGATVAGFVTCGAGATD